MIVLSYDAIDSEPVLPFPGSKDCSQLRSRIATALLQQMPTSGHQLNVEVDAEGTVVLSGRVRTFYAKQLAYHASQRLAEGHSVIDSMVVDNQATAPCWNRGR